MKLLSKKKFLLLLSIILLFLVLKDSLKILLFFDVNAPDLSNFDGNQIKSNLLENSLSLSNIRFSFMSYISFLLPLYLLVMGYDYDQIKNNHLKYNIGKNKEYTKKLFMTKLKLSSIVSIIIILIFSILIGVSIIFNGEKSDVVDQYVFHGGSLLYKLFNSNYGFLFFTLLSVIIACMINGMLLFYLIDYFGFIKSSLYFLLFIWVFSMILYRFLPYYLVPMSSIMITSYRAISVVKILLTYIYHGIITCFVHFTRKYEVS